MATNFLDFQFALMEGYIILTDVGQQPIEAKGFREKLCSEGTAQQAVGASLRWAVGVNPSRHTELVLQALPLPTKFLLPGHHVDNVATISIFSLSLPMVLADDSSFEGPIPQIFSNCPSDTLAALHNKPLQIHQGGASQGSQTFPVYGIHHAPRGERVRQETPPILGQASFPQRPRTGGHTPGGETLPRGLRRFSPFRIRHCADSR